MSKNKERNIKIKDCFQTLVRGHSFWTFSCFGEYDKNSYRCTQIFKGKVKFNCTECLLCKKMYEEHNGN